MAKDFTEDYTLDLRGRFALWTRPESKSSPVSYRVPTPEALRGLFKTILHIPGVFPVPKAVTWLEYRDPLLGLKVQGVQQECIPAYFCTQTNRPDGWFGSPVSRVYILGAHYRVTWAVTTRNSIHSELQRRIRHGIWDTGPFLGTRECGCTITLPDPSAQVLTDLNFVEPMVRLGIGGKAVDLRVEGGTMEYPFKEVLAVLQAERWGVRNRDEETSCHS